MRVIHLFSVLIVVVSCQGGRRMNQKNDNFNPVFTAGPPTIVYKTKADYRNLVPVLLSEDRTKIISYPDPSDIKSGTSFPTPTQLNKGYLLDNRGIGNNVAFLKITYEEYAILQSAPSPDDLYNLILDKDPLEEFCNCGNRNAFKNIVADMNHAIDEGLLTKKCKVLK